MNAIHTTICAGLLLASLAGGAPLRAGEFDRDSALRINEANELLRGGNVDGAIGAYEAAREFAPESADLSYNMAVAKYRQGDVAAAEPLFQAAAASENDSLAARSRYNLGNCDYTAGLQLAEKDRPAAIEKLESAITNYRSSLAVDGNDADARANIELASQLIEKLKEEQKQQEQQQKQNQQNQQQQDQQQQSDDQQQNGQQGQQDNKQQQDQQQKDQQQKQDEQQKNDQQQQQSDSSQGDKGQDQQPKQDQQSQQDQQSEQDKSQQEKQDKSKDEQGEQSKQDESQQNQSQSESQSQQDSEKESQQQPQTPQKQQQQPNKSPQQNPPTPADEPSDKQGKSAPQGELSAASEKEAKDDGKDKQQVAAFDPTKDGEMTQQEAEKMLQAIRDRDMLRRLQQQRNERNQYVPVDRDW
jgi:Ca-activated chloride channel homolog